MKTFNLTLLLTLSALIGLAQTPVNDNVLVLEQYSGMVYYKLSDGSKTTVSNVDWHLAVSVRPTPIPPNGTPITGVTVRINEQSGVKAYVAAGNNASTYNSLDTSTMGNWATLHDDDTELDKGALNSNADPGNQFDFGWGKYNNSSHDVVGDSVYVFTLPGGAKKKVLIQVLGMDTAYDIQYSNLDNSNARTFHVSKSKYAGKNFVYLNLLDYSIKNKEPMSTEWDLLFTKYTASDVPTLPFYGTVGVLINKGTTVAKVAGRSTDNLDFTGLTFNDNLNSIGWDWKTFNGTGYDMADSLAYFIRTQDGTRYQLVFTAFGGSTTGNIAFTKTALPFGIGINEVENNPVSVFPNPTSGLVNVQVTVPGSVAKLMDMNGRVIAENKVTNNLTQFNTSGLQSGMYLLAVTNQNGTSTTKLVVTQ